MNKLLEVLSKFLDFLNKPNGLGVFVCICIIGLLFYVLPLLIVGGLSYDNTNRLEAAIGRSADRLEKAIENQGSNRVANY